MRNFCRRSLSLLAVCLSLAGSSAFAASAQNPTFEMDVNGNAVAVWLDAGPSSISIQANTYVSGVWGTPQTIMTGGVVTQLPIIGVNAVGGSDISAVVAWADDSGISTSALFTAMLTSAAGTWTSPNQVPLGTTESVGTVYSLRVDSSGNVVLVYDVYDTGTTDGTIQASTSVIDSFNLFSSPTIISQ